MLAGVLAPTRLEALPHTIIKSFGVETNIMGFMPRGRLTQGPDGTLYGTTSSGDGYGTVFKVNANGMGYQVLKWFGTPAEGAAPYGDLVLADNILYGTTSAGGSSDRGTVFRVGVDGSDFAVLKHFSGSDGSRPYCGLTLSGDTLYGTTYAGGSSTYYGTVFSLNTNGSRFAVLVNFWQTNGANPYAGLVLGDGVLYGTTYSSSGTGLGVVFRVNADGSGFRVLRSFSGYSDGTNPYGGLALANGTLYGTTYQGGSSSHGTVFKLNIDGSGYAVLKTFDGYGGWNPYGTLVVSGSSLYGTTYTDGNSSYGTVYKINVDGTGYTVIKQFGGAEGRNPCAGLLLTGTTLYGTTLNGGSSGLGSVFRLDTAGSGFATLVHFTTSDTAHPGAALIASGEVLYGTARQGSSDGKGCIFRINADGTHYQVLKWFTNSAEGATPSARLTVSAGVLYGTALQGGSYDGGTVFKLNTNGSGFTLLKLIDRNPGGGVTLSGSTLYGTTVYGGNSSQGSIYKLDTDGTGYAMLKQFSGTDGAGPRTDLLLCGSTLYGTTMRGGSTGYGTVFKIETNGTGFAVLKNFVATEAINPLGSLVLVGGALYGTTSSGPYPSCVGTVYRVSTNGTGFAILRSFTNKSDASYPQAGLALSGNVLYGTSSSGGAFSKGNIFKLNTDGSGFAVLKSFNGGDGADLNSELTLVGSRVYGVTSGGGALGLGTLFYLETAPQFTSFARRSDGSANCSLTGEPGRKYEIFGSTNLVQWDSLTTVSNETGTVTYTDTQASSFPARFYRAAQLP